MLVHLCSSKLGFNVTLLCGPILRCLSRPLYALLQGAPEGATAPRWGRVRCGEAWPLAGSPGGHAPDLAAQKYFCISYPLPLSASAHVALTGDNGGTGGLL